MCARHVARAQMDNVGHCLGEVCKRRWETGRVNRRRRKRCPAYVVWCARPVHCMVRRVYPPPARATAGSRSALQFQQTSSATAHSNNLRKVEFWTFASSTLVALASSSTFQHQQPKLLVCKKHFDPLTLIMDCDGGGSGSPAS